MLGRVKLSDQLFEEARSAGETSGRSPEDQISHWVRLGRAIERSGLYTHLELTDLLAHGGVPETGTGDPSS